MFMGVLSFVFLICSLRTNIVFVLIFITATLGFVLAVAAFWTTAKGMSVGAKLLVGTGGSSFLCGNIRVVSVGGYSVRDVGFAVAGTVAGWGLEHGCQGKESDEDGVGE
jgi:hypothetical protein